MFTALASKLNLELLEKFELLRNMIDLSLTESDRRRYQFEKSKMIQAAQATNNYTLLLLFEASDQNYLAKLDKEEKERELEAMIEKLNAPRFHLAHNETLTKENVALYEKLYEKGGYIFELQANIARIATSSLDISIKFKKLYEIQKLLEKEVRKLEITIKAGEEIDRSSQNVIYNKLLCNAIGKIYDNLELKLLNIVAKTQKTPSGIVIQGMKDIVDEAFKQKEDMEKLQMEVALEDLHVPTHKVSFEEVKPSVKPQTATTQKPKAPEVSEYIDLTRTVRMVAGKVVQANPRKTIEQYSSSTLWQDTIRKTGTSKGKGL